MNVKTVVLGTIFSITAMLVSGRDLPVTNFKFKVVNVFGSETYMVVYKSTAKTRVKLNVYDQYRQLIYSETRNSEGFIRPLNFRDLNPGEYVIEIQNGTDNQTYQVNFTSRKTKNIVGATKVQEENQFLLPIEGLEEGACVKIFENLK